ncbi:YczE/YyaS/YitT family protein [Maledivibacter halophilus]|uniref:Uncharacterized membrane protein YczE n=1 Tax=Maledivibacter halophilus TaxID=36842 RepID=A0A1T5LL03_9FIRM|nr:YitT family protein [Maledivibacter halophilus]SKC76564.1 Uncharacterized membrane protein YczE [Maledivibacter halophilus]
MVILKRLLTVFIGVYFIGLGIAIEIKGNLGINALTLFCEGLGKKINVSLGTASIMLLTIIPLILFFIDKRRIGIGTFVNGIVTGFLIDFHSRLFSYFTVDSILIRFILMLSGVIITGIGIGIYINAQLGEAGIDAIMVLLADRLKTQIKYVRIVIDIVLVILGFLMGGSLGISTFVSMVLYGVVIDKTLSAIHNIKTKSKVSV